MACAQVSGQFDEHQILLQACLLLPTKSAVLVQHASQEFDIWLADKKGNALQQLKKLQEVLEITQGQAADSANRASSHNQNVEMLAQKEQQYIQQLQNLEQKLMNVNYSPLVSTAKQALFAGNLLRAATATIIICSADEAQRADGEARQVQ